MSAGRDDGSARQMIFGQAVQQPNAPESELNAFCSVVVGFSGLCAAQACFLWTRAVRVMRQVNDFYCCKSIECPHDPQVIISIRIIPSGRLISVARLQTRAQVPVQVQNRKQPPLFPRNRLLGQVRTDRLPAATIDLMS